jgi:hypothetical protein
LLSSDLTNLSPPDVDLLQPSDGQAIAVGVPFTIVWKASDPDGLQRFDVHLSTDGGATFDPLPGCELLDGTVRECVWASPGPATSTARLRVVARDLTGDEWIDQSMAHFSIVNGAAALPNLRVTSLSGVPATASPGDSFSVLAPVHNDGDVTANESTLRFYLSADQERDSGDALLPGKHAVVPLSPGGSSAGVVTVKIPKSAALGAFYVLACADDLKRVAESDESNCLASVAPMFVGKPDLVTTVLSRPPATVSAGQSFAVFDSVQNPSPFAAASSATRYYLSFDSAKGPDDIPLSGIRNVPALAAGAASWGVRSVTVPAETAPGKYRLLACADDNAKVSETDEGNNCRTAGTTVRVTGS